jgi:flagellar motor switch protein FliN/FliY
MTTQDGRKTALWLTETWAGAFSRALESMTGVRPTASWGPAEEDTSAAGSPDSLWWEQPLSLAPNAVLWVGAPAGAWREMGAAALRALGIESGEEADARSTYLEILKQSLSGLAQAIGQRVGREVSCENGREIAARPATSVRFAAQFEVGSASCPAVYLALEDTLLEGLEGAPGAAEGEPAALAALTSESAAPRASFRTLDLLMEVELPVSVSFGRAELPLKDVLKLTSGSIVELNRSVNEPVEVIVNNCVIARGEVVVVEGNYGVRIGEIISPQERLRTLK